MKRNFRIGGWLVEPQRLSLSREGVSVTVKPRSMAVLVELAAAEGQVVERRVLMDRVWGHAEVSDDVLTQSIVELRRALGDDARDPRYIETIKRIGFRLIPAAEAPSVLSDPAPRRAPWLIASGVVLGAAVLAGVLLLFAQRDASIEPRSVAVLPFDNYSSSEDHFADGFAEELLDALTQVPDLRVLARTSSFSFRDRDLNVTEIGRRLGVAYLVEGSVRRDGSRIRVTVQLIESVQGFHRWSRTYEYDLDDVFLVQRRMASDVADALAVNLGAVPDRVTTKNPKAYERYLAGRHHFRIGNIERSIELFEQAVKTDPSYALAHSELAKALVFFQENPGGVRQSGVDFASQIERARAAAAAALALAPAHADVHIARAAIAVVERNTDTEQAALERAIALNPASVEGYLRLSRLLVSEGHIAQAIAYLDIAEELDPLNPELAVDHAGLIGLLQGYDAAVTRLNGLIELDLTSPRMWDALLGLASDFGRYVDRVRYAVKLESTLPDSAWPKAQLGDAFTELGEFDLADVWISAAERISPGEAFKSRARWYAATRDFESFARITQNVADGDTDPSADMSPAQSALAGLHGLAALNAAQPARAVVQIRRVIAGSPTLLRRKPHIPIYTEVLLARALAAVDDEAGMRDALRNARARVAEAERSGINRYPWLTLTSAATHQLAGAEDAASRTFRAAASQGWRAWYLEQFGVAQPLTNELATIELIEADLARMREVVRQEGLRVAPPDSATPRRAGN